MQAFLHLGGGGRVWWWSSCFCFGEFPQRIGLGRVTNSLLEIRVHACIHLFFNLLSASSVLGIVVGTRDTTVNETGDRDENVPLS